MEMGIDGKRAVLDVMNSCDWLCAKYIIYYIILHNIT